MNITDRGIQHELIERVMDKKYSTNPRDFYYYLFEYIKEPVAPRYAYLLNKLITIFIADKVEATLGTELVSNERDVGKILDGLQSPDSGFLDMVVIKIPINKVAMYAKIWETDLDIVRETLDYFIKGEYDVGTVDPYINEFEKLRY